MKNTETHSRAKLALAVLTSPKAAFEEILQRRLLGTALIITAAAGLISIIETLSSSRAQGPAHLFMLGHHNPLIWLGLCLLYAAGMRWLLKWLGHEVEFSQLAIILGWSQISLVVSWLCLGIGAALIATGHRNPQIENGAIAGAAIFQVAYIAAVSAGLMALTGVTRIRSILSYLIIELAAIMGFSQTYRFNRESIFAGALPGIRSAADVVVSADMTPWVAAGAIGIVLGVWYLLGERGMEMKARRSAAVIAGVAGLLITGLYVGGIYKADYYGKLMAAQRDVETAKYDKAAVALSGIIPITPGVDWALLTDMGDLYYQAGDLTAATANYQRAITASKKAMVAVPGKLVARARTGLGNVYYAQKDYPKALSAFTKAGKEWPEFREPWIRAALVYDQTGQYDKAIESGNHAIKKLESESTVAWVALAEAFAQKGDLKQAKAAYEMIVGKDPDLAKRIGSKPEDWKIAADKLTRDDLKYPLEKQDAPTPKPQQPKRPAKK